MLIGIKDAAKLAGIAIIACCAVLVCTLFINFYLDILQIEELIAPGPALFYYNAQVSTAKVVCLVSGGCLLLTAVVMLLFYIRQYIDTHKRELGILKALGYSDLHIAGHFWVFGLGVLTGAAAGFLGAFLLMPAFYELQNKDHILPAITMRFHPAVLICLVLLPSAAFSTLAVLYACRKLRRPVLSLLKNDLYATSEPKVTHNGQHASRTVLMFNNGQHASRTALMLNNGQHASRTAPGFKKTDDGPFLEGLRRHTLRTKKTLTFFIAFASFCFSSMTQMAASMTELSSTMMAAMILLIGLTLAFTSLLLAITTVVKGNARTIALMQMTGYSQAECRRALLDGYRPVSCLGFALGTAYQYLLLRIMVDVVFGDIAEQLTYEFDVPAMLLSLVCFFVVYEAVMYVCASRIRRFSVKELLP